MEQAYAALQAVSTNEVPPLEQLRPQLEEGLRRQAVEEIETSLLTGADITFYGPDGKPRSGEKATGGDQNADGAAPSTGQTQEGAAMDPASTTDQTQAKTDQAGGNSQTGGALTAPGASEKGTGGAETSTGN